MQISIIQAPIFWEQPDLNRNYFEQQFHLVPENTDLVVLPEMFTSGFTMQPQNVAEPMDGETMDWLKKQAKKFGFAITGSLVIIENGQFYNRLVFVSPDEIVQQYDKRHLFTLACENQVYEAGKDKIIFEYQNWRICPMICYDLRFPVFARNIEDYDLLIYVANWPSPRIQAWNILLQARAVENMSYVIGVNRMGEDANSHLYSGHSQVVDFMGNHVIVPQVNEGIFTTSLSKENLQNARDKFKFLEDRDHFQLI